MVADLPYRFKAADKAAGADEPTRKDCAHYPGWMGVSLAVYAMIVLMSALAVAHWFGWL